MSPPICERLSGLFPYCNVILPQNSRPLNANICSNIAASFRILHQLSTLRYKCNGSQAGDMRVKGGQNNSYGKTITKLLEMKMGFIDDG
jgi:hypothetical protein